MFYQNSEPNFFLSSLLHLVPLYLSSILLILSLWDVKPLPSLSPTLWLLKAVYVSLRSNVATVVFKQTKKAPPHTHPHLRVSYNNLHIIMSFYTSPLSMLKLYTHLFIFTCPAARSEKVSSISIITVNKTSSCINRLSATSTPFPPFFSSCIHIVFFHRQLCFVLSIDLASLYISQKQTHLKTTMMGEMYISLPALRSTVTSDPHKFILSSWKLKDQCSLKE